jgi:hypothetical protein
MIRSDSARDQAPTATPVALLIFNRPGPTGRVFEEIRRAQPERLLVVADGPRPAVEGEADRCAKAREITEAVDWPCEVSRNYAEANLGCKRRVSSGVDWVFEEVEEAILLEDDCLPDPSFFPYCEELLDRYRDDERVMHIGGGNLRFGPCGDASYFFSRYPHVWGWASWRRAWRHYDVDLENWAQEADQDRYLESFETESERRFWRQIWERTRDGDIDTWDFQWVFACMTNNGLAINPNLNLISNIGVGEDSTNTTSEISELANLPLESMDRPLRHPESLERQRHCDAETARRFFSYSEPPAPKRTVRERTLDPVLRLGGRLLEYVPEPVRPRIRDRDRRPPPAGSGSGKDRQLR